MRFNSTIYNFALPALAFALPLGLYIKTLAPTYIPIDSAEIALCMKFWGACHPPGFPTLITIGKIFVEFFPLGSVIYRANLLTAIFGALTILFVYLAQVRLNVGKVTAFLAAILLAVSSSFWEFAIAADVFTFATFLIALTIFLALSNRKYLAAFTLGVSVSHFYISAVIFPILVWYFWKESESEKAGESKKSLLFIVYCLLFFTLGLFGQAVLYFRLGQNLEINWGHAQGLLGYFDFLRRKEFGSIFLLKNPVLTFSLLKFINHFRAYFTALLTNFGVILPVLIPVSFVFANLEKKKELVFLAVSALVIIFVQLFLLSTIDPLEPGTPFQINKFYLSSFVFLAILIGKGLQILIDKFLESEKIYAAIFLTALIFVYFTAGERTHNFSKNYFSQNLVLDAMGQLPEQSVGITLSHIFYFGGVYEQKIDGKFQNISLLYFPNEKNRDMENYNPQLFEGVPDAKLVEDVKSQNNLGSAEQYILSVIAGNLDRQIFVLQGDFEEKFFSYLKPYLRPHGLWWRFEGDKLARVNRGVDGLFAGFRNESIKKKDLHMRQQQLDILTYAVSYHSAGIFEASFANYDGALNFLQKSLQINPEAANINNEIDLIKKTRDLEIKKDEFVNNKDSAKLSELANNYFTLMNYTSCIQTYAQVVQITAGDAKAYNNMASCFVSLGQIDSARQNYQKALEIDPNLDLAKRGLEALGE